MCESSRGWSLTTFPVQVAEAGNELENDLTWDLSSDVTYDFRKVMPFMWVLPGFQRLRRVQRVSAILRFTV